jgi:hypothetical protein
MSERQPKNLKDLAIKSVIATGAALAGEVFRRVSKKKKEEELSKELEKTYKRGRSDGVSSADDYYKETYHLKRKDKGSGYQPFD